MGCVVGAIGAVDVGMVLGWTVGPNVAVVGAHVPLLATQLQSVAPATYNEALHAQPLKAALLLLTQSMSAVESEMTMLARLEHALNADGPMYVTESGITIDVRPTHPLKAELLIATTLSGISIDVRLVHP